MAVQGAGQDWAEQAESADCTASEQRCGDARCEYGVLRYYDDRTRCEECYCQEPCHGFQCPAGTSCQVEPYTARGETIYKGIVNKYQHRPGQTYD